MIRDSVETEEKQVGYFLEAKRSFDAVRSTFNPVVFHIRLAKQHIALHFCSPELYACIKPALAHLECEPAGDADFNIGLWESGYTGVDMPPPPCSRSRFTDRGDIWGFNSDRIRLAFIYGEYSVNIFDRDSRWGLYWVPSADRYPYWSKASPLRPLLHWCMELSGNQLVHGAAVGCDGTAVLITGKGGIGKSTTSLEGLSRGMQFAGDDYIVVSLNPEPCVYSLYATAKVNPGQEKKFPRLQPHVSHQAAGPDEKTVFRLFPAFKDQLAAPLRLTSILVPEITGGEISGFEVFESKNEVKHHASFTTVCQLPRAGQTTYAFFHRLVEALPTYWLKLGTNPQQLCECLIAHCKGGAREVSPAAASRPPVRRPRVTAIIPVYNRQHYIRDAIENVMAQNYPSLELIVVDDGSDDGTAEVIRKLPYDVRVIRQPNEGPAAARNRGILNATGEFIAFLDSDDLWPDGVLQILVDELVKDPDLMVAKGYSQFSKLNPITNQYELEGNPEESFPYSIPGSVFRAEAFAKAGLLDAELQFGEDTDWFNRARELKMKVKRVPIISLIVRRHQKNMTLGKSDAELGTIRVFKKALDRKRRMDVKEGNP